MKCRLCGKPLKDESATLGPDCQARYDEALLILETTPAEIAELRAAGPKHESDAGVEIAVRTIAAVRPHCDGVHIMAIKAVDRLPEILTKAGLG